jgi:Flp pilus assembly protein TadG
MNSHLFENLPRSRKRERGSSAIELALVLPILVTLLTFPVFYARCLWHYTAAQKAAQDAARYMAGVPAAEMRSRRLAADAQRIAEEIARQEIAELAPGTYFDPPQVTCDGLSCGSAIGRTPSKVRVYITFGMADTFFGVVDTGRYGLLITADVTMRYAGN